MEILGFFWQGQGILSRFPYLYSVWRGAYIPARHSLFPPLNGLCIMKNMNAGVLFGGLVLFGSGLIYSLVSGNSLLNPQTGTGGNLMVERIVLGVLLLASIGLSFFLGSRKK